MIILGAHIAAMRHAPLMAPKNRFRNGVPGNERCLRERELREREPREREPEPRERLLQRRERPPRLA
jgi:hypothetical protein